MNIFFHIPMRIPHNRWPRPACPPEYWEKNSPTESRRGTWDAASGSSPPWSSPPRPSSRPPKARGRAGARPGWGRWGSPALWLASRAGSRSPQGRSEYFARNFGKIGDLSKEWVYKRNKLIDIYIRYGPFWIWILSIYFELWKKPQIFKSFCLF